MTVNVVHSRVPAAHGRGAKTNRVGRLTRVATKDHVRRLARDADESNLPLSRCPGEHLEMPRKQLQRLLARAMKANCLSLAELLDWRWSAIGPRRRTIGNDAR